MAEENYSDGRDIEDDGIDMDYIPFEEYAILHPDLPSREGMGRSHTRRAAGKLYQY